MGKTSFEEILERLKRIHEKLIKQDERITRLEQKVVDPLYEYRASLSANKGQAKKPVKKSYPHFYGSRLIANVALVGALLIPRFLDVYKFSFLDYTLLGLYISLIAIGFTSINIYRKGKNKAEWPELSFIVFAGSAWYFIHYLGFVPQGYLILFINFLSLLVLVPYVTAFFTSLYLRWYEVLLVFLGAISNYWGLYQLIFQPTSLTKNSTNFTRFFFIPHYSQKFLYFTLSFLIFYIVLYVLLFRYRPKRKLLLNTLLAVITFFAFLLIGVSGGLNHHAFWISFYSILLLIFGIFLSQPFARLLSYLGFFYGVFAFIQARFLKNLGVSSLEPLYENENVVLAIYFLSLGIGAYVTNRYKDRLKSIEKHVPLTFLILWLLIPVYWIMVPALAIAPLHLVFLALYSFFIFCVGTYLRYYSVRIASYWIFSVALFTFAFRYKYDQLLHPRWILHLNLLFATFALVVGLALWITFKVKNDFAQREKNNLRNVGAFILAGLFFFWGSSQIILNFDVIIKQSSFFLRPFIESRPKVETLQRTYMTDLLLTLYYGLFSFIILAIGLIKDFKILRIFGFVLLILMVGKLIQLTMYLDHTSSKILAFSALGILLIAGSLVYQHLYKIGFLKRK